MKTDSFLPWVLIISTFLIAGKALGLLDISWAIAFGPVAALMIVSVIIFLITGIIMYKTISKKIEDDE